MTLNFAILFGILIFIQSTIGGLLRGGGFAALSAPALFNNYGRIAAYQSPIAIAPNPFAATYSSRYTAYAAVPLVGSGLVSRNAAFASPSFFRTTLGSQDVTAYAAVPIAGYRASFGGPSPKNYGFSTFRSFPTAFSSHGLSNGIDDFSDSVVVNGQNSFGIENQLSVW